VQFECSLIDPFRVNRKLDRFPNGLEDIDSEATRLVSRRSIYPQQLLAEVPLHSRQRFKADDEMKGQKRAPRSIVNLAATSCNHHHNSQVPDNGRGRSRLPSIMKRGGNVQLTIRPLTPDVWPALEDLFGKNGACNGCWCMYWRIGAAYRRRTAGRNKAAFHEIVRRGPPPGLVAFDGDVAVGWCQLTPRDALPWLDRAWRLKRVDQAPVWSLSCFYVRIGYRKRGVTSALITAALRAAKRAGAVALEAYPLDATKTPSASGTGYATAFERLGFRTVACQVPPRPIMRHDLKAIEP
jgi:GNAT superfamily N-acetyltransferase